MNILIVGTVRPSHEYLLNSGHKVVLLIPQDQATVADLSNRYAHTLIVGKDTSTEVCSSLAANIHSWLPFDFVVSFTDLYQKLAYDIAQHIGVRCMVELNALEVTRNKYLMREKLARAGISSCKYQLVHTESELHAAIASIGLPCILKPVAGQASLNVIKLETKADIQKVLTWVGMEALEAGMILEEFLVGTEYSVEAVSEGGKHHIVAITDKYKDAQTFVEVGHVVPAYLDEQTVYAIKNYVSAVLTELGFQNSGSHTELIVTSAGARIIETHTRLGGDRIIELVRLTTGIDLFDLTSRQAIGESIADLLQAPATKTAHSAAVWYADPSTSPKLCLNMVLGVTEAKQGKGVTSVEILKKPGSRGSEVRHSHDRSAYAIAVGDNQQESLQLARAAIAKLEFCYAVSTPDSKA
jgi:biotin carboxylase